MELSLQSDIITYEIESGDSKVLESLHGEVSINPSPTTLKTIQDKYLQKQFLHQNNIPVAEFDTIESLEDLEKKSLITNIPHYSRHDVMHMMEEETSK